MFVATFGPDRKLEKPPLVGYQESLVSDLIGPVWLCLGGTVISFVVLIAEIRKTCVLAFRNVMKQKFKARKYSIRNENTEEIVNITTGEAKSKQNFVLVKTKNKKA